MRAAWPASTTSSAGQAHDEIVGRIAASGHRRATLRVFEQNRRARRFYERRGWCWTGERSTTTFEPRPVLVHYELGLDATRITPG